MVVTSHARPLAPPPLFCPLPPVGTYHDTSGLDRRAVRWADRWGLVDATERERLGRIGIGLLTSLIMPHGLAAPTQLAADFSAWLFAFDDCHSDEGQRSSLISQQAGLVCELTRILECPEVKPDPRDVFTAALRDLRVRLASVATHAQVARWVDAMRGYLAATIWESANRADSIIPSLNEYTAMRLHSGALKPSIALLDVADGYELPAPVLARPDVRALIEMTCLLCGWDNDIISYAKEAHRVGDGQNLIDVIVTQERCPPAQALESAVAMRDRVMCLFLSIRDQTLADASPNLRRYVTSLGYWVRGNIEWGSQSARYRSLDGLSASPASGLATQPADSRLEPLPIPAIVWWWRTLRLGNPFSRGYS